MASNIALPSGQPLNPLGIVARKMLCSPNFVSPLGKGGQLELPHADMIEEMDRMKRLMKIKEANGEKEEPKIVEMHDFNP